jgi:aminoglycoside phosphotransferase family enzyme/predicted kinase
VTGNLFEDLLSPDAYPEQRPASVELRETHISAVHLLEADVYKVKKPVDFGFLDFSTRDKRREACEAEVRLNRRLSPEVYLGVVPITRGPDGRHRVGGDGEVVEHAVHMQRVPDDERADRMLGRGALGPAEIDRIATAIARFHEGCRADAETARHGTPEAIGVNVQENFAQTRAVLGHYLGSREVEEFEEYQLGALREMKAVFEARSARGAIRDGHGDLRLEHFYLRPDGRITILDCIEFNDRFRYADVACDLAFLTMDLAHHRRVDLAEHLLAAYARESNDFDLYSVIDFYESYRAHVRAKIETFLAENEAAPHELRRRAAEEARRYFLLAIASERPQVLRPMVVAVGGIIAAGKSTLAGWIAEQVGAPIVEADRTRKHMLGVAATTRVNADAFTGAYDKGFTDKVYEEMNRRAGVVLASGRPVILDASFRSPAMRLAARALARAHGVPFVFLECRAPAEVCKARLASRQDRAGTVSDARLAIFDDFVKEWQPVMELSPGQHVVVETSRPEVETHAEVKGHVTTWPDGLAG